MTTPAGPTAGIPSGVRQRIDGILSGIETAHGVRILLSVESGSRAWGFPSVDSDYDVRFIYVHPLDWYLSLREERDVIERPIDDDLDVNGWDLRKALRLLGNGNPVLREWLVSPIRYREDPTTVGALLDLAHMGGQGSRTAARHHYRRLAESAMDNGIRDRLQVKLKKYFYALRPACALAWLRTHDSPALPMDLPSLMDGLPLEDGLRDEIGGLLALKATASEMGAGERRPRLERFIEQEIGHALEAADRPERSDHLREAADDLFRSIIRRYTPGGG